MQEIRYIYSSDGSVSPTLLTPPSFDCTPRSGASIPKDPSEFFSVHAQTPCEPLNSETVISFALYCLRGQGGERSLYQMEDGYIQNLYASVSLFAVTGDMR